MTLGRKELDSSIYEQIKAYCSKGDELAEVKDFEGAIAEYNKAWLLIPDPKNEWNAATWVLTAIADVAFLGGYNTSAREALEYAMTCPGGIGNPFLHLRYGQALLDAGEEDAAAGELMRAYMAEGEGIFSNEDPRYLEFLRGRAKI